jgi:hypothetical protein
VSALSAIASAGTQLLGWIAREPCERNPEAVAKAWAEMSAHAPALADCGRMYAAYGRCFTVQQLSFITRHSDPLSLARWVSSGWAHLRFDPRSGFIAEDGFLSPRPQQSSGSLWAFTLLAAGFIALAIACVYQNQAGPALGLALMAAVLCLLTLVEFVDVRCRHNARRAIEACTGESLGRDAGSRLTHTLEAKQRWRLFRVKRGLV